MNRLSTIVITALVCAHTAVAFGAEAAPGSVTSRPR